MSTQFQAGAEQAISDQPAGRLDSWKEIASYLKRDIRTVQRWEKEEGLPVHRLAHKKRGSVFAHREELDLWWSQRGGLLEKQATGEKPSTGRMWLITGLGAIALVAGVPGWLAWHAKEPSAAASVWPTVTASPTARELYTRGVALEGQGEWPAAIELLKEAYRLDPKCASCGMRLAFLQFLTGKPEDEYRSNADLAIRGSESVHHDERLHIRGQYYEILGQRENAVVAYKALAELHADEVWTMERLGFLLLNLGRSMEAANHWAKHADSRPSDFRPNLKAAVSYFQMVGDQSRAAPYLERARGLATSVSKSNQGRVWVDLMPAFEAWQRGHADQVEDFLDKTQRDYASGEDARWAPLIQSVGLYHMAIGQLNRAEAWFRRFEDPSSKSVHLAMVALARNEPGAIREHLVKVDKSYWSPTPYMLKIRAGPDSDIDQDIEWLEKNTSLGSDRLKAVRGELAYARGNLSEAIALIREHLAAMRVGGSGATYFLSAETLAAALAHKGKLPEAVTTLETLGQQKAQLYQLAGPLSYFWMRTQVQLVRLYKKVGREEDARNLGNELLNLLSRADEDNPMLLELTALMKPTN